MKFAIFRKKNGLSFHKYGFSCISIEWIVCCRPIELLEKRGLLSQVWGAGGAAAWAINPAPLFGLNFNPAELKQVVRSSLLDQIRHLPK